jgi:dihydroorotate dehydrogenase (fumarate)
MEMQSEGGAAGVFHGALQTASLAATSGVHTGTDAVKLILVGTNLTMMTSALLQNGIDYIKAVEAWLCEWMDKHEYESVEQIRGSVSQMHAEAPSTFERAQYIRALTSYRPAFNRR